MAFDVYKFTADGFRGLVANERATYEYISSNPHKFPQVVYLAGYLGHLGAKTVVVEHRYVDRDYLADYSSYYASCFDDFGPRCKRLHFFSSTFTEDELRGWITAPLDDVDAGLQGAYLGFVVVRPLPEALIGRTVLATYQQQANRTYAKRKYKVSLFGINLTIESLAYQQQDNVVAACATVALWTAFHKTSKVFEHPLLRPAEITATANRVQGSGRAMPSHGLRPEQIFSVIRRVGLEPVADNVNNTTPLMSLLKGYLDFGLPVVLFGIVPALNFQAHAIAVSGYSLGEEPPEFTEPMVGGIKSVGRLIEKIYVHDDNIGPFARSFPVANPYHAKAPPVPANASLLTYGLEARDQDGTVQSLFVPYMAVVPVYGKIRIRYAEAHAWIGRTQNVISQAGIDTDDLRWSLSLTTTQRYKALLRRDFWTNAKAAEMLIDGQPRFIWRGVAQRGDDLVLECLIDATGVWRSCPVFAWMWHDDAARASYEEAILKVPKSILENLYSPTFAKVVYPEVRADG